jgi:hypothetical protein
MTELQFDFMIIAFMVTATVVSLMWGKLGE